MATIESFGTTSLQLVGSNYLVQVGASPALTLLFGGVPVTAGQFGAWAPIGAEQTASGFEVVWQNGSNYVVWNVDSTGVFLSQSALLTSASAELQSLEPGFSQDLNGSGGITPRTVIESSGSTTLANVATAFVLSPTGSSLGPQLRMSGALVVAGQFGAWTPIGAEKMPNGTYLVFWKNGPDQYIAWTVDSGGNYISQSDVLSGASIGLLSLEPGFNQDLNGSGGITPRSVVEASGSTTLANIATAFVLSPAGSSLGPQLRMSGALVTAGQFGAWTPIGAEQMANGGYQVVWKNGAADQYVVWNTGSFGNWLSQTGMMFGSSATLQLLEAEFNQDLNGVGGITARTVIESSGSTALATIMNTFVVSPTTSALGQQLMVSGAAVTVGQFGNWTPIGAEQASNGVYQVAWKNGLLDQYLGWNVDSSGNFLSQGAVVTGGTWYLQVYESSLHQDLNGDGTIGPITTTIESVGSTSLTKVADSYFFNYASGGPQLKYGGSYVTPGQFANWTVIGAEQASNGMYQVAWKNGPLDQYLGWNVDSNGNYLSQGAVVAGGTWYTETFESSLHQDLNGDGTIGPITSTIEAIGAVSLTKVADSYFFNYASGGPQLKMNGAYVATGQFGAWTPVGVEQGGNGYWIAWKNGPADQYIVWQTDGAGNFLGNLINPASGTTSAVQQFEPFLHQDLNGDGVIPIEAFGATKLVQSGSNYVLDPMASLGGPLLKHGGANVTAGEFGANWTPIAAEQTPSGYRVAWYGGNDQYTVWNTDPAGNHTTDATGIVSGGSADLQGMEASLQQDLNRDGVITSVSTIESFGATSLVRAGNAYLLGGIYGPELRQNNAAVNVSQLGSWTAIGAEQVSGGYQVAFKAGNADLYQVWNTDSNGNYVSTALNPVSGSNLALESFEPTFQQDLNGDGYLGHFDIVVDYTGNQAYASYFTAAAQAWEQVIRADLPDVNTAQYGLIDDLRIEANVGFIDGVNGTLGQATYDARRSGAAGLPYLGHMTLDSADLAVMANNGTLFSVILHEMGHVLGIGTLWSTFGLTSGSQYIGADAVNAYHQLGGTGFVPIETGGGPGSAFVHWSEAVFDNELMTPKAALPGVAMPLSILTIGGVQDLGYKVDYAAADPYSLPGHLEAGEQRVSMLANTTWAASAFDSQGTSGFDSAFEPTLLADDGLASGGTPGSDRAYAAAPANDAVGNSASAASAALLTNYLATAFIAPAGLGAGTIAAMQMSDQDFLAKPVA